MVQIKRLSKEWYNCRKVFMRDHLIREEGQPTVYQQYTDWIRKIGGRDYILAGIYFYRDEDLVAFKLRFGYDID